MRVKDVDSQSISVTSPKRFQFRTDTVSSWQGGQMRCVRMRLGRMELGLGWITRWTIGIRWLNFKHYHEAELRQWHLHIGRLRLGFGWRAGRG